MTHTKALFTSIAAALLLSGTAFAADQQPAAGEGPFFQPQNVVATSQLQRADVRTAAASQTPLAGNLPMGQQAVAESALTRAQVREATREAINHGYRVQSGDLS